ncbi:MAG: OmpA family protein [Bacteroidales bacterium]|nr:OmpA family protein [Bacteroidales bacterium]
MKIRLLLLAAALLLLPTIQANAQTGEEDVKYNSWSVYAGGGWLNYYGDIARAQFYPGSTSDENFSWNVMLGVNKTLNPIFGFNVYGLFGKVYSQKQEQYDKYLEGTVIHYNLDVTVSLSNLFLPKAYDKKYNVYMLMGIGNVHYRTLVTRSDGSFYASRGYENDQWSDMDPTPVAESGDKTDMKSEASYNIGGGVKFKVNKRIAIGAEIALKPMQSDKFDGVNRPLTERDRLGYTNLLVQYTFGKNEMSHEWNPIDPTLDKILKKIQQVENDVDSLKNRVGKVEDDVETLMKDYEQRMDKTDSDGDGVPDWMDIEPNTPPNTIVNWQGVALPIEKDLYEKDGDRFRFDENGNPILKEGARDQQESFAVYSVFFALNSTYITSINHERIATAARVLKKYPDLKLDIVGEACKIGTENYNDDLSERRAKAVKDILVNEYGIDAGRLNVSWNGELKPLSNKRLFINRRVDIMIAK